MAGTTGTSPRILLLVTGGIAAYKSCYLARLLVQAGFSVRCAMTDAATHFVSPMTFEVLTGAPVAIDLWGERGTVGRLDPVMEIWRDKAADVHGKALPGGHFLAEECPDETLAELLAFL